MCLFVYSTAGIKASHCASVPMELMKMQARPFRLQCHGPPDINRCRACGRCSAFLMRYYGIFSGDGDVFLTAAGFWRKKNPEKRISQGSDIRIFLCFWLWFPQKFVLQEHSCYKDCWVCAEYCRLTCLINQQHKGTDIYPPLRIYGILSFNRLF